MRTSRTRPTGTIAAVVGAGALLASTIAARADCSVGDFWNAIENSVSSIADQCAAICADTGGAGCVAAGAITAGLGGVSAEAGSGKVADFCNEVSTIGGDVNALQQWANAAGISIDLSSLQGSGVPDPLSVLQCSCSLEQGISQLGGDVLSCMQDAICSLQQDLGWGRCGCHPPLPVAANCTPPPGCVQNNTLPGCENAIYGAPSNPPGQIVKQLSNGTMVIDVTDGWDGSSYWCSPDYYCFCPSPMQLVAVPNDYENGGTPANGNVIYYCQCPNLGPGQTTHPAAPSGPMAMVCICDNTGQPAVPPVATVNGPNSNNTNPTGSICPTGLTGKTCPAGQVNVGGNCVVPCSSGQVMTPDGTCCNPNGVTSCGACCPPGTSPNLSNGTCSPNQIIQ